MSSSFCKAREAGRVAWRGEVRCWGWKPLVRLELARMVGLTKWKDETR